MDSYVYEDLRKHQEEHWWFKARREIITTMLNSLSLPRDSDILEIGCGTGGNLEMLGALGNVSGVEMHQEACEYARTKSGRDVRVGRLPDKVPFDKQFDLICLLDVVEHIENDKAALEALSGRLKPGGRIFITVPAYQWMYGKHDKLLHHHRRYSRRSLTNVVTESGIAIEKLTYFNAFLLPITVLAFIVDKLTPVDKFTGYDVPVRWLNATFYNIFRLERFLVDKFNLPFGSSLLLISEPRA